MQNWKNKEVYWFIIISIIFNHLMSFCNIIIKTTSWQLENIFALLYSTSVTIDTILCVKTGCNHSAGLNYKCRYNGLPECMPTLKKTNVEIIIIIIKMGQIQTVLTRFLHDFIPQFNNAHMVRFVMYNPKR